MKTASLTIDGHDYDSTSFIIGLLLAVSSSFFIGTSFIIKKLALKQTSASGNLRASAGGYGYLKQWMWWTGLITMGVGEMTNLLAYAFAPAALVTPLGALSVIVTAVLSSKFLNEKLNIIGKIGCFLCVIGSIIFIIHSPKNEEIKTFMELIEKLSDCLFLTYVASVFAMSLVIVIGKGYSLFWCGFRVTQVSAAMRQQMHAPSKLRSVALAHTMAYTPNDLASIARTNLLLEWSKDWKKTSKTKGLHYAYVQPDIPCVPWKEKNRFLTKLIMDAGFVKAESTNLPRIDALMVGEFVALNPDFCSAEQRNDKASIVKSKKRKRKPGGGGDNPVDEDAASSSGSTSSENLSGFDEIDQESPTVKYKPFILPHYVRSYSENAGGTEFIVLISSTDDARPVGNRDLMYLSNIFQRNMKGIKQFKRINKFKFGIIFDKPTMANAALQNKDFFKQHRLQASIPASASEQIGTIDTTFDNSIQNIAIQVRFHNTDLYIVSIYCPHYSTPSFCKNKLDNLIKLNPEPMIVAGDFYAHNTLWGCHSTDNRGRDISEIVENNDLFLLNDGRATTVGSASWRPSAIDLTIVSSSIALACNWEVHDDPLVSSSIALACNWEVHDDPLGSYHLPVMTEISLQSHSYANSSSNIPIHYNLKLIDWKKYSILVNQKLQSFNIMDNVIDSYNSFCGVLHEAVAESSPKRPISGSNNRLPHKKPKLTVPWWNITCSGAVKASKQAYALFKSNSTPENYVNFKRLQVRKKIILKLEQKKSWQSLCESFNRNTPIKFIWQYMRKFNSTSPGSKSFSDKRGKFTRDSISHLHLDILKAFSDDKALLPQTRNQEFKTQWLDHWKISLQEKGKWFGEIQKDIRASWFDKGQYRTRDFYTTLSRLRIGHCLFKDHLYRLKMVSSPVCC
ncbi:hypothetical protein evm_014746 [Chilo suppressalis]|nr:hypothetical protein evm_014746 [Chilo suppressalis]